MILRCIVCAVSLACSAIAQGPLRLELKHVEKKTAACIVTFQYPEIVSAATPQARRRMNAGILRLLLRRSDWPGRDSGFQSLAAHADDFIGSCTEFQKEPEPAARSLYEHKLLTVFRYTPPILSLKLDATEDGGGVHPFGTTFFVNFDLRTGKIVRLSDLVKEGALPKLEAIAEANLRITARLSPTDSLSENGYNFPGDRFRLNDNFGVGEHSLVFLFNTEEISAGAMGAVKIKLSYGELHTLLKPGWRL